MQIKDKTFVVTGGGNGIGREVVLRLLADGARVAALDLSVDGLAETTRLAAAGDRLTTHAVNVADRAAVEAARDEILAAHTTVDGLVNVAGIIQPFIKVAELPYEQFERVMNVNFWGVAHTTKTFLPLLLQRPEASLVNVSSMGALAPVPGQSVYGASKAAVKLFTEALYTELLTTNVAVTVVFPGAIATDITGNSGVSVPGREQKEAAAASKITPAPEAGRQIVAAIAKGSPRLCIGSDAKMLDRLARLMPTKAGQLIAKKMAHLID